ncbi:MAG: hypothetical protein ISR85_00790 [Kiritimatiellales bacterium]|nr:hypothetical protein [Kiritimatiellota bacterium]MBL7011448.1 hypothetical protein [Kiritimatiellales bacterium]
MTDPIVEEIRKYRDEHARKFNYDLSRICEDFRQHREERLAKLKNSRPEGGACRENVSDRKNLCVAEEPGEGYGTKPEDGDQKAEV